MRLQCGHVNYKAARLRLQELATLKVSERKGQGQMHISGSLPEWRRNKRRGATVLLLSRGSSLSTYSWTQEPCLRPHKTCIRRAVFGELMKLARI
jgi:hypothetical protein